MRLYISIFVGKFLIKFIELLRKFKIIKYNASVFPGSVAKKICPDILNNITYPKTTIFVTGSTGKGSTTKMITKVLLDNGYTVTTNYKGSNLVNAFITMLINDSSINGKIKTDYIVYEVDERYLKLITKYIKPDYLVINNITRDQPPRNTSFEFVFNEIKKGIYKNMHLIVNADDPLTKSFELYHKGKITYYGIEKNFMSTDKEIDYTKDNLYCPNCNSKLKFNYYHYGSVGDYKCNNCGYKRENVSYDITNIDKKKMTITINNKDEINITNYILFNLYNIITVYSVCDLLKIDGNKIIDSLNNLGIDNKIYEEIIIKDRKYITLNCKAENNATYNLALLYTSLSNEKKTIVLGLNEISRRYNYFDLSWLYDISFELLNDKSVDKIICAGPYKYDIALRMKYAGIDEKKLIIKDNLDNIKNDLKNTKGDVYAILNFDYIEPFKNKIRGDK